MTGKDAARVDQLLHYANTARLRAYEQLDVCHRRGNAQFLSPTAVADLMASMFSEKDSVSILDAGAGVGSLTAAYVSRACTWRQKPKVVRATVFEVEPVLVAHLRDVLRQCKLACEDAGVDFGFEVVTEDFIGWAVRTLKTSDGGDAPGNRRFTAAILNPPYAKISRRSRSHQLLCQVGMRANNLYAAFIWLAIELLQPGAELVAITPRSFCNGPSFRSFRRALLASMALTRIHVFESRERVFGDDDVQQENVIVHALKRPTHFDTVTMSSSKSPGDGPVVSRQAEYDEVVPRGEADTFIHILLDEFSREVATWMRSLSATLADLHISVSTGRVVDFRVPEFIRDQPDGEVIPLIYPGHLRQGVVIWPNARVRKPSALAAKTGVHALVVPAGAYVLVKRFSAKEDQRRVIAAVYEPQRVSSSRVGFENHLNYYHRESQGLPLELARGLAVFLNSTLVDLYLRQFNGHTQVNAADLRNIRYPSEAQLLTLGTKFTRVRLAQEELDGVVASVLGLRCAGWQPECRLPQLE